jgi:hypothetical protein
MKARDAEDEKQHEDPRHADEAGDGEEDDGTGDRRFRQLTDGHDSAAIETIRGVAGNQNEDQRGAELNQADEAEVEGA